MNSRRRSSCAELLALAAARLGDPLAGVDERAFDLERQIIGSEHLVRADPRAGQWAVNALFPQLFPAQHPYARPTGGTEDSRRHFTLADARAYVARTFRPQRMTVLVTAPPGALSLAGIAALLPASLDAKEQARTLPTRRTPTPTPRPEQRSGTRRPDHRRAQAVAALGPRALARLDAARRLRRPGSDGGGAGPLGRERRPQRSVRQGRAADSPRRRLGAAGRIGERAVRARDRGGRGGRASPGAGAGGARLQPVGARAGGAAELRGLRRAFETERILDEPGLARARGEAGVGDRAGRPPAAAPADAPSSAGSGEERRGRRVRLPAPDARARARDVLRPAPRRERRRRGARRDGGRARGGWASLGHRADSGRGGLEPEPLGDAAAAAARDHRREAADRD